MSGFQFIKDDEARAVSNQTNMAVGQTINSGFLQSIKDVMARNTEEGGGSENVQALEENPIFVRPDLKTRLAGVDLGEKIAALKSEISNDNQPLEARAVIQETKKEEPTPVKKIETSLISFRNISEKMIRDLESFGLTDFTKIGRLEIELGNLKKVLQSLTENQGEETRKINTLIALHEQIVEKFEQIKNIGGEQVQKTLENTSLALSDVQAELGKLKEDRDNLPNLAGEQKINLEDQIKTKVAALRELHKDATSEERRNEILKTISVLEKIKQITSATEEVRALTEKLDPEKLAMFLKEISVSGFISTLTSKKPEIPTAVNDNETETQKAVA